MKKKILQKISTIKKKFGDKKIYLHEPSIHMDDIKSVVKALSDNEVSTYGKYTEIFEKKISNVVKNKNIISTINGTSALHLALKMMNVNENTEVLVPSLTYVSTVNAIIYNQADPHFIDINPENLSADIIKLDNYLGKITLKRNNKIFNKKTKKEIKFLLLVHLNGLCCNMDLLVKVLKKYNIKLIEDAAEAFGSFYKNKHLGTFGEVGIFSFNGNKVLTTGGGGAIVFKNKKLFKKGLNYATNCKTLRKGEIDYDDVGYNYRMPSINASLGISQINKLNKFKEKKKKLFLFYKKIFSKDDHIKLLIPHKNLNSNYWLNTIIIQKNKMISKKNLEFLFKKQNIFVRSIWKPIHLVKRYNKFQSMNLSQTEKIYKQAITLPSSPFLWR
ncbi:MAG: aminotransferase [Rickettsiales bacterium]|nr:aminotransferase [Rickettsiales bacterium]